MDHASLSTKQMDAETDRLRAETQLALTRTTHRLAMQMAGDEVEGPRRCTSPPWRPPSWPGSSERSQEALPCWS